MWRYEVRNGKATKPPFQTNGNFAQTNNPETWTDFTTASTTTGFNGIGFTFAAGDGLVGIDLDHCILSSGELDDWAAELIALFKDTYIEKSPSGDGLHIIVKGKALATGARKWKSENGTDVGIEVYDYTSPRYFTVTSNVIQRGETVNCQNQLERLYELYFTDDEPEHNPLKPASNLKSASSFPATTLEEIESALSVIPSDEYQLWIQIGMALKSAGVDVDVWDRWSARSAKYQAGACDKKWDSFHGSGKGVKAIFYFAKQFSGGKWQPPKPARIESQQPQQTNFQPPSPQEQPSNVVPLKKSILAPVGSANNPQVKPDGRQVEHSQWADLTIPYEFRLGELGLAACDDNGKEKVIAGPIAVIAQTIGTETNDNDNGIIVEYITRSERLKTLAIPIARLYQDPKALAQDLGGSGLHIAVGKEKDLLRYLEKCSPPVFHVAVTQTGWVADTDELIFVLPNSSTKRGYHFQPERHDASAGAIRAKGTLQEWTEQVFYGGAGKCEPYPMFAFLLALSSPLLKFASMDTGGFHFYGGSSSGKTTLAQLAASTFGNGSDPSDAPSNPFTKRWNSTLNALEGLAAAFNDLPLIFDEIGSCNSRDFGKGLYDLSGGQGKSAMDANRQMRKPRTWRNKLISTGEMSSLSKIEETQFGKKTTAKAGQLIRLIDIEVKPDMFAGRAEVDKLKRACTLHYGTIGPAFITELCAKFTVTTLRNTVLEQLDRSLNRLVVGRGEQLLNGVVRVSALQERALRRFAIAEVAGLLLVYLNLIPGLTGDIVKASIDKVVDDWLPASAGLSDTERAINALKNFILKYRDARIKNIKSLTTFREDDKLRQQIAGYYDEVKQLYYILPEAMGEACPGAEPGIVAAALRGKGYLETYRQDALTNRVSVDGRRVNCYCFKSSLLGSSVEEDPDE